MKTACLCVCLLLFVCSLTSCEARRKWKSRNKTGSTDRNAFGDVLNYLVSSFGKGEGSHVPEKNPSGQNIRLTDTAELYAGLLEVYINGKWGYVCDDQWTKTNADVACRQLGFLGGAVDSTPQGELPVTGDIVMDDVTCRGSEVNLHDCEFKATHDCLLGEAIRLQCKPNTGCPSDFQVAGKTKCYGFYKQAKTIITAQQVCQKINGELLKIESEEENHFLSNIFNAYKSMTNMFWYTSAVKKNWRWRWANKNVIKYTKWMRVAGQREPVVKRGYNCMALTNKAADRSVLDYFYWRAMPCKQTGGLSFVCQRSKQKTAPRPTTTVEPTTPIPVITTEPPSPSSALTVRLVGGKNKYEGNVEVVVRGEPFRICDDSWDDNDATVICRMLDFNYGGVATDTSHFGRDSPPIILDDVKCTGQEPDIGECVAKVRQHDCTNRELAGVICNRRPGRITPAPATTPAPSTTVELATPPRPATTTESPSPSSALTVRLVGGENKYEGNVEVVVRGEPFRICDDSWDDNDATVICRMLNFNYGGVATDTSHFGRDSPPIILDDVKCTGQEPDIGECVAKVRQHDCTNRELAGVICNRRPGSITPAPATTPAPTTTERVTVRLVGGKGRHSGTVEVTRSGVTGVICDDEWDLTDGHVVCRMLNYKAALHVTERNNFDYTMKGRDQFLLDDVNCTGRETNLAQCKHRAWGENNCGESEIAGVECVGDDGPITPEITTPTPTLRPRPPQTGIFGVRLVGGDNNNEGNVELTFRGQKYGICDDKWGNEDANVICRMLGFNDGGMATSSSHFGRHQAPILLDDVDCAGDETEIGECRALVGTGKHNCIVGGEHAGVICNTAGSTGGSKITPRPQTFVPGQCGQRPFDTQNLFSSRKRRSPKALKIVGGEFATHGEYPWMARIHLKLSAYSGTHWCGAAIINNYWLLSAAHCYTKYKKHQYRVVVGDHDITHADEGEQTFSIDKLIRHSRYNPGRKHHDIVLIKIKPNYGRAIQYNNYVQPACLATSSTPHTDGRECYISGWGDTKTVNKHPKILKAGKIPIWSQAKCRYSWRYKISGGYQDGMMCAGHLRGGEDTCQGDSGGPFVCNIEGSYTLFGLTSFGSGCAKPNSPGVYARVSYYLPWIKSTISTNSDTREERTMPMKT